MIDAEEGVSYGVQVRDNNLPWRMRFGWFPESHPDDGSGLDRAQAGALWLIKETSANPADVRVVKRTVTLEVV